MSLFCVSGAQGHHPGFQDINNILILETPWISIAVFFTKSELVLEMWHTWINIATSEMCWRNNI